MKKFLAIYTGTPASTSKWDTLPEQEKKSRQDAMNARLLNIDKGGAIY